MSAKRQGNETSSAPPAKKAKLLLDEEDFSSGDEDYSNSKQETYLGASPPRDYIKINEEFARRFEHNKKREDQQRLEEKYGRSNGLEDNDDTPDSQQSSSDESEDDGGILATRDLDAEITDALNAIRAKDPRIYDKGKKFYKDFEPDPTAHDSVNEEKPMYLHDYHRRNLLEGYAGDVENEEESGQQEPISYTEEQENLKKQLLQEMHAAAGEDDAEDGDDSGDEADIDTFLKAKPSQNAEKSSAKDVESQKTRRPVLDPTIADQDPETYLSNFMTSRAWVPDAQSRWQPFDSDDSDDEARADAFEEAYNMRFEDPEQVNEKLVSHARDMASKYSVRREEPKRRKKAREEERAQKEEARKQREEEKARLRKLRIESVEGKVKQIKEAAGLGNSNSVDMAEWGRFLDEGWDDDKWEEEMKKRFGEGYYAESDKERFENDGENGTSVQNKTKRKPKKPKWDEDIDIKDLVPDYDDGETAQPPFELTDDEATANSSAAKSKHKKKSLPSDPEEKRKARTQRRQIEALVDASLATDPAFLPPSNSSKAHSHPTSASASTAATAASSDVPQFRYRETSPTAFGLTARDILLSNDAQLNEFAGLKKLASFRDPVRKRKDRKKLGSKARLREWRRETFGDPNGPKGGFKGDDQKGGMGEGGVLVGTRSKAKKRGRRKKKA
ncbi:MAG: KRRI-Interacting protein 1 [Bathelium mastoideum]|nr:MAG: KRRI-Interacting protein 1 [Bathelium mastoideum]KAI9692236.1 MAG: KRRI-Interacting protein 1 [Bathelium mastoideum]